MIIRGDKIIFNTGKAVYANGGIIGISGNSLAIYEGHDGGLDLVTREEKIELADYMLELWKKYRQIVK